MCFEILKILNKNFKKIESILDCGCGEMTNTSLFFNNIKCKNYLCFDISLNRLIFGKEFLKKNIKDSVQKKMKVFSANLDSIPLPSNSIDILITLHAIEPNAKKSKNIIRELYRVCKKGMILNEPNFIGADTVQKKRMKRYNYATKIENNIKELGLKYKKYLIKNSINLKNKTASFVIFKKQQRQNKINYVDPYFEKPILNHKNFYRSKFLNQVYFVFNNIPIFDFWNSKFVTNKKLLNDKFK